MKSTAILNALQSILLFAAIFALPQCNKHKENTRDVVQKWIGKTIVFPDYSGCMLLGEKMPCHPEFYNLRPYKLLVYTDSTGCTSCKLRLDVWKYLMKDADATMHGNLEFLFYFYPKNSYVLHDLLKKENFKTQVYINDHDELNQINKFPTDMDYQCFLLDKDNRVLTVGNPSFNPAIWALDKNIVNGKIKASDQSN